jgi:tetratricopeptide (TPR) repeat protein
MSANFELAAGRIGTAQRFADLACKYANKRTGSLAWGVKARVCDAERDRAGQVSSLRKALEFDPQDHILRHQLGVALSRASDPQGAITEFSRIIDSELATDVPSETLLMALKTRIINLRRLGRETDAADDLAFAYQLLDQHPHLRRQRTHIEEVDPAVS